MFRAKVGRIIKLIAKVSTKELYTLKTDAAYLELHTHASRWQNSQRFVSNGSGDCWCCCAPPLDATSFKNGYPATEKLVSSSLSEEMFCNGCATCISHKISHGTTQSSKTLYEMHVAQMLQTLSSLTVKHTTSYVVEQPFSKLVASSGGVWVWSSK
jgi:hypothetical protein